MNTEAIYLSLLLRIFPKSSWRQVDYYCSKAGSCQQLYESLDDYEFHGWAEAKEKWLVQKNSGAFEVLQEELLRNKCNILSQLDESYPALLKQIPDAPKVIFVRGTLHNVEPALAIVGSRRISDYGRAVIPKIIDPIVRAGVTVVSGLAYGVDAEAHEATLNKHGHTWAILGSGLAKESIYPRHNLKLAERILTQGGALISEYPPAQGAQKHQFIARNRIIAGLSSGTLVVECAQKSGALITADLSMDYNRSVYAIPGPINSLTSQGTNFLIQQGAQLVTCGEDILQDMGIPVDTPATAAPSISTEQSDVLKYIQSNIDEIEALCLTSKIPISTLNRIITELEMMQLVSRKGSKIISLT